MYNPPVQSYPLTHEFSHFFRYYFLCLSLFLLLVYLNISHVFYVHQTKKVTTYPVYLLMIHILFIYLPTPLRIFLPFQLPTHRYDIFNLSSYCNFSIVLYPSIPET